MSETLFDELRRYVRFGREEESLLRAFRPRAASDFERIAQQFYERIREHEAAHAVFTGEPQIARLQQSLVRWLERIFTGPWDEAYFRETAQIGRVHVNVGLAQHYMFTAMALIRVELTRVAERELGSESTATREAITRLLDLELAIMLEGYRAHVLERAQRSRQIETEELTVALARAEHRYVNAVEAAPFLVIGLDREGVIRLFNREAETVSGYARDEVVGRRFDELFLPPDQPADAPFAGPMRLRSGRLRDIRWHLAQTENSADDVTRIAIGRDVTDELVDADRSRQTERLAAVGTLAAGLAHEIRNPLNGAQLHLTFLERALKRSSADADSLEAVHVVTEEIRRLGRLVSEFLEFARPAPLQLAPASVRRLCERVSALAAADAEKANVELGLDLPANDANLEIDAARIEQVLLNLVRNAIEAVEARGGGHVTLRARRQPRHETFEVEDDGPGIGDPDAPIFDAFYSTKNGGTGLGLAIVHRIVSQHGGTVSVESRPGRTVFRLQLPLAH